MPTATTEKRSESVKIQLGDFLKVKEFRRETGLPITHAIGVCIEAWQHVPVRVRERLLRDRRAQMNDGDRRQVSLAS